MKVWEEVDHEANKKCEGQSTMTYVRPHTHINKQTSPIFNCVTPESVSLACQFLNLSFCVKKIRSDCAIVINSHQISE